MQVKTRDKFRALAARQRLTILLVRPDGIGDEILCLPVATALRHSFSDARIVFLSSEHAAPVLEHHPDLDGILTIAGHEPFRKLVALFRDRIDAVIFLKPSRRLMAAAFVARVPVRVATGFRWYSIFANRRMYQHRSDFAQHESEYNLQLLAGLGMKPGSLVRPRLVVTTLEREWAEDRIAPLPTARILIRPGGLSARHWKMQHFWDLSKQLLCRGYGVILTGSQAEQQRWERECGNTSAVHSNILDLKGQLTVRNSWPSLPRARWSSREQRGRHTLRQPWTCRQSASTIPDATTRRFDGGRWAKAFCYGRTCPLVRNASMKRALTGIVWIRSRWKNW